MKEPEDEAFEELALKQGHWQHTSGWRKKQIMKTSTTDKEAMKLALVIEEFDNNNESLPLELLKPIAETLRALADPMREVQRLGQEIEQEQVGKCGV